MKTLKDLTLANIAWTITILVSVGIFIAAVTSHGLAIAETKAKLDVEDSRIDKLEIAITKIDVLTEKINEIKNDVKDIKKIVLIPIK